MDAVGTLADHTARDRFSRAAFFIVDANYFGVGLLQARQALRMSGEDVAIHIFLEGAEPEAEQEAKQFQALASASGGRLFLHRDVLTPRVPDSFPHTTTLPKLVYGRFFAPEILTAERIVYLDADILIQGRLDELFEVGIGAHPVAAVHDFGFIASRPEAKGDAIRELRASGDYFNAGVLLIDRERWLASDLDAKAAEFFAEHREQATLQDQDFLNWIYRDNWAQLSPRWNCQAALIAGGLESAVDPVILHFSGSLKPWHAETQALFPRYAEAFRDMAIQAGVSPDWRPRQGRVSYGRPLESLKYRLMRALAGAGYKSRKMRKRLDEWRASRDRCLAFIEALASRGAFADSATISTIEASAHPSYDGRRYWASGQ